MDTNTVINELENFIKSNENRAISLTGEWGIGKTYLLNDLLKNERGNIQKDRVAITSLFGLKKIEEIKLKIAYSLKSTNKKKNSTIERIAYNSTQIYLHLYFFIYSLFFFTAYTFGVFFDVKENASIPYKILSLLYSLFDKKDALEALPQGKLIAASLEAFVLNRLENALICIDDIERADGELSAKEFFGLIDHLLSNNCQVILIFSEKNLDEKAKNIYREISEKVIYKELNLTPNIDELAEKYISDQVPEFEQIRVEVKKLEISNIRLMIKICDLAAVIYPLLRETQIKTKAVTIHTLVLYTWSIYGEENTRIPPEIIRDFDNLRRRIDRQHRSDTLSEIEIRAETLLKKYDIERSNELSKAIEYVVKYGVICDSNISKQIETYDLQVIEQENDGQFRQAWDIYHQSLKNNGDEIAKLWMAALNDSPTRIDPMSFSATVSQLRELGYANEASRLVDIYLEANRSKFENLNPQSFIFYNQMDDSEFKEKLLEVIASKQRIPTIEQAIQQLLMDESWTDGLIEAVATADKNQLRKALTSVDDTRIWNVIKRLLSVPETYEKKGETIKNNTSEILKKIALDSPINRLRMKSHGFNF